MQRAAFLIVLILLLCLPALQMVTGFPPQAALEENRQLAPVPSISSWRESDRYARDWVNWFNDHFGFRSFLIRSKTQIDYSVFGMSTRVHIGRDGWLFYRSVVDVEQPAVELALRNDADAVVDGVRQLAHALAARNIRLIIAITPMKDVYYSKYLPPTASALPAPRQVDLLQDRLKSMTDIVFIDSKSILEEIAKERTVFHRTDFHWNDPAAFEVARALVNEIGELEGRREPTWTHTLEIEEKRMSGGEATFMPIFFPPKERALFVKPNWVQPAYDYVENRPPFEWIYAAKIPTEQELPPLAVLGDSFFDGMVRSGMRIYFKKIYLARVYHATLDEVLDHLPSDTRYFFVEFIEVAQGVYSDFALHALQR